MIGEGWVSVPGAAVSVGEFWVSCGRKIVVGKKRRIQGAAQKNMSSAVRRFDRGSPSIGTTRSHNASASTRAESRLVANCAHLYMFVNKHTTDCGRRWGGILPVVF